MKLPQRIHYKCLPKTIQKSRYHLTDNDGFIHGYFVFNEKDDIVAFMNESNVIFECTRPVMIAHTHLIARYHAVVFTGTDKSGKRIGELCELTFWFN